MATDCIIFFEIDFSFRRWATYPRIWTYGIRLQMHSVTFKYFVRMVLHLWTSVLTVIEIILIYVHLFSASTYVCKCVGSIKAVIADNIQFSIDHFNSVKISSPSDQLANIPLFSRYNCVEVLKIWTTHILVERWKNNFRAWFRIVFCCGWLNEI